MDAVMAVAVPAAALLAPAMAVLASAAETVQTAVFDANLLVAGAVAFAAGLVSFASPCVVPLVPGYLSFMTGLSGDDLIAARSRRRTSRVLVGSLLFVVGFAIPFVLIGMAVSVVNFLYQTTWIRVVMGLFVVGLGLAMASGRLMREFRVAGRAPGGGLATAPLLGFVFGVGWTPCIGPTAAAILTLAGASSSGMAIRGGLLGFVYALGLGVPFILFGLLFRRATSALDFLKRNGRILQAVGGVMLIAVGIAMATGLWNQLIIQLRPLINGFTPPI